MSTKELMTDDFIFLDMVQQAFRQEQKSKSGKNTANASKGTIRSFEIKARHS